MAALSTAAVIVNFAAFNPPTATGAAHNQVIKERAFLYAQFFDLINGSLAGSEQAVCESANAVEANSHTFLLRSAPV
jgi:hypothetical protein